jgi:hypothetical protein
MYMLQAGSYQVSLGPHIKYVHRAKQCTDEPDACCKGLYIMYGISDKQGIHAPAHHVQVQVNTLLEAWGKLPLLALCQT